MSDERRRPPPRFPRGEGDDEVVRIEEPPETERIPLPLPAPKRLPDKAPLRLDLHKGRQPSYVEMAAALASHQTTLEGISVAQAQTLAIQRKMSLQVDHLGSIVNQRFDVFHKELSLLRATVKGDHEPRLGTVESKVAKLTPQQKAKAATLIAAKFGAWGSGGLFFGGMALRALAKVYPQYGELIESALGAIGL